MHGSQGLDKHVLAKKSMLKALISKMHGLMADGHSGAEAHMLPHEKLDDESGESSAEQMGEGSPEEEASESPEEEQQEDFNPDDVKGFMAKTSNKPKAKHSMAMMSVAMGKAQPKGHLFKKKA